MGRPPLPLGTYGRIYFLATESGSWQARTKFRDYDGRTRLVGRTARSRSAAERALKIALADRVGPATGPGAVHPTTRVNELAELWLATEHGWSISTRRVYASVVKNQVSPAVGQLRLQEVTPGLISRALTAIGNHHGAGVAKSTRACLSSMFKLAVQDGALNVNPVRDAVSVKRQQPTKSPRALTRDEVDRLTAHLRSSARANEVDLPDIVDWMLATGCRIGEALALRVGTGREGGPLLDLDARTWEVDATVVRETGVGLFVQPQPKTAAGWRVIALPDFAIDLVRRRLPLHERNETGLVLAASILGTPRDPSNVAGDLRQILDAFECETCHHTGYRLESDGSPALSQKGHRVRCDAGPWSWLTSHTFRKTVATRLDEAGFSARQVADQLGYANPSMTLDVYFGRRVVSSAAASVLNR